MTMAEKKRLTEDGLKKLEMELEELKTVKRKEIAEKIKVALSFGDLSENSEYDEAKNEQAIIESKITQLEAMLKNVEVVDTDELSTEHIGVGSKVRLKDLEFDEEEVYHIVGSAEADPMDNKISDESPMGKALLGHKLGDDVQVEAPAGAIHFKVMEIFK
ncbi:MAG: transcription elongation factor GreA [Oscillospiraceae bacterium]|nr:transcription elongation factor GreA [Oscillospiraceae bacterium]MDY4190846.1 transcription elongation factor GreA [Oscillospiraceae bacterium]